jgi:CHAD domain-containing protein
MSPSSLLAVIAALQTRLHQDRLHLSAGDPGALHALRVNLRQLRSLLKPLDTFDVFAELADSAQALAARSGPARDQEVLLAELRLWQPALAGERAIALAALLASLAHSEELAAFYAVIDNFTGQVSWHDLAGKDAITRHFNKSSQRWRKQIIAGIDNLAADNGDSMDRHALRRLIKRLRYNLMWQGAGEHKDLLKALKQAQARIGEWHDRCNWIAAAEHDPALASLASIWRSELTFHADAADASLHRLQKILSRK